MVYIYLVLQGKKIARSFIYVGQAKPHFNCCPSAIR